MLVPPILALVNLVESTEPGIKPLAPPVVVPTPLDFAPPLNAAKLFALVVELLAPEVDDGVEFIALASNPPLSVLAVELVEVGVSASVALLLVLVLVLVLALVLVLPPELGGKLMLATTARGLIVSEPLT